MSVTDSRACQAAQAGPVLAVVGWSGSGKTTLLEFLVSQLAARGLRVNVVKHSHHDIELEPPHKDSARLRMAGAAEVMIASPYRYAILRELHGEGEPTLAAQIARLAPADLTLVEGYKWEPLPKLEVFRPGLGRPPLYVEDPLVVAVASDAPPSAAGATVPAWLDLNTPGDVLTWLTAWMKKTAQVPDNQAVNGG